LYQPLHGIKERTIGPKMKGKKNRTGHDQIKPREGDDEHFNMVRNKKESGARYDPREAGMAGANIRLGYGKHNKGRMEAIHQTCKEKHIHRRWRRKGLGGQKSRKKGALKGKKHSYLFQRRGKKKKKKNRRGDSKMRRKTGVLEGAKAYLPRKKN